MIKIENEQLCVSASTQGAELQSVIDKRTGREWLWQGDAKYWGRRAPVLFPIIGGLRDGQYVYEGVTYAMPKHGFARDRVFEAAPESDGSRMAFVLRSDAQTRALYPFDFELRISYVLEESTLSTIYEVLNAGQQEMLFSIGGHPALNCPMAEASWRLLFENGRDQTLPLYTVNTALGLIHEKLGSYDLSKAGIDLNYGCFKEDALIFENLNPQRVTLQGPETEDRVRFEFEGFPLFAVWSAPGPFVCLEPWYGMADFEHASGRLEDKHQIQKLAAGAVFRCTYRMVF